MEELIYSASQYKILSISVGFIAVALETFLPVLPILAIVIANSFVLGMWLGFLVSWSGSCIASVLLYLFANKFAKVKFLQKYHNYNKTKKVIEWIKNQGFNAIFISYACPFIPDFLVTICSGFISFDFRNFLSGMICGKFVMFLLVSYIGEDINNIFDNPIKILLFSLAIMLSWVIGQKINNNV